MNSRQAGNIRNGSESLAAAPLCGESMVIQDVYKLPFPVCALALLSLLMAALP